MQTSPWWDQFECELAAALSKITTSAIGRECQLYKEQALRSMRIASGREILVIILRRYEVDFGGALQVDVQSLLSLTWKGKLEEFLDAMDTRLSRMTREPDDQLLSSIVIPQLRQCKELELDYAHVQAALALHVRSQQRVTLKLNSQTLEETTTFFTLVRQWIV